jgi:EAL domain-containing protein (putative c-di-GMP-specific phosphodiesterase class I)
VERLPAVLDVEAIAVLHFARDSVRSVAASGPLRPTFPPSKALAKKRGTEIASRSEAGAWLENASAHGDSDGLSVDIAFVPFRLGMSSKALGCLVFAGRPGDSSAPMSHRLPDLIDATSFIVGVLRPAIERAQTAGDAITTVQGVIARHEFTIHLQPIARLDTGVVVAAEALTRFASGISPDVQFAEAARLGLGLALERATLTAAIVAALGLPRDVALSVNVSPDVLQHEPRLGRILATAKRPVIVELTEHERIDDYGAVRSALGRLGSNVRLAVDDAGSGYASLRHILALKPTYVKLDIEWVRGIDHDPVRRALVTGLSTFASETGCELIAEGIETEDERQALLGLGVRLGQGYLLGRPEPMAGGSGRLNTLIAQSGP